MPSISCLLPFVILPLSRALPAAPAASADAGILSPAEWAKLEVLVDRRVHFEIDPTDPTINIVRRDDAATSLLHRSVDVKSCTDPYKAKMISEELLSVKGVLQQALSMEETHPIWGNLTYVGNVVDNNPNALQRTKNLFAAAMDILDGAEAAQNLTFTCISNAATCEHFSGPNGTSYSVTSVLDSQIGAVKLCDAFFTRSPLSLGRCSSGAQMTTYSGRTGTLLHELFHAIGITAKDAKDRTRELFDLISYDYANVAGLARGVCSNANYPNLACDPNFTLVNIDSLKWAANGYYWYEKCKAENTELSLQ